MSSPACQDDQSTLCMSMNCLDDLILLSASYLSLFLIFVAHISRAEFQYDCLNSSSPGFGDGKKRHRPAQGAQCLVDSQLGMVIEMTALLATLVIDAILYMRGQECPLAFTSMTMTIYLLGLLTIRMLKPASTIRSHSALLYIARWLFLSVNVWTLSYGYPTIFDLISVLTRFICFTSLCLLHGFAVRRSISRYGSRYGAYTCAEAANLLSRITFSWMNKLIWRAYRRPLQTWDLYALSRDEQTSTVAAEVNDKVKSTRSLIYMILNYAKSDFLIQGGWAFVGSLSAVLPPVLIQSILQFVGTADESTSKTNLWFYVSALLISGIVTATADCQANWIWRKVGAKTRSMLLSRIYDKVLRRGIVREGVPDTAERDASDTVEDQEGPQKASQGDDKVLNMISVDVEIISNIIGSLYLVWVTFPIQMILGTYLLTRILGTAGIFGVAFMLTLLPINFIVSRKLMTVQSNVLQATDGRLRTSSEILNNIRNIKYNAWEAVFIDSIRKERDVELERIRSRFIWWSLSMTLFYSLPVLMTLCTLCLYTVAWGHKLGTDIAFPALAMFTVMRIPINRMADSVNFWLQASVSLKRVRDLLMEPNTTRQLQSTWSENNPIGFDGATLTWSSKQSTSLNMDQEGFELQSRLQSFSLQNLNVTFVKGSLNTVIGPSGSGKSSLLLALLGEMELLSGTVLYPVTDPQITEQRSCHSTAYCPQEPWILNRSIRENILLGQNFDAARYRQVLHAVSLLPDLADMDRGDETLCGDSGDKLSGGQKQRVALARAIYSTSKYILLDDCLSAVDTRSAHHIFANAILGPLMSERTCIFATHYIQLVVPHSSCVVILDGGAITAQGPPGELRSAGFLESRTLKGKETLQASWSGPISDQEWPESQKDEASNDEPASNAKAKRSMMAEKDAQVKQDRRSPVYNESKPEGFVPWTVVQTWLKAMGNPFYWVLVTLGFILQQVAGLSTTLWLKQWAENYDTLAAGSQHQPSENGPLDVYRAIGFSKPRSEVPDGYYIGAYLLINVLHAVCSFLKDMSVFHGSLKASRRFYYNLLGSIMGSTLQFFDRVPIGQITNRLSRDIEILDQSLPTFFLSTLQLFLSLLAIVIFISFHVPEFLGAAIIIFLAYYWVCTIYLHAARDLKRIEAVERSPLYQQFGESVTGCLSIRSYGLTRMFESDTHQLVDQINLPYLLQFSSKEWLSWRIGILSSLVLFFAGLFIVLRGHSVSPGIAGMILTYAASFTETISWLVQIYATLQQDLNSCERVLEFVGIKQEAQHPLMAASQPLSQSWPEHGSISFRNYTTRYAQDLDPALEQLNIEVSPGKRLAIVGRTGSGKSTFALSLIRGLEASSGSIEIDGIDVATVPLKRLRKAVTLVSQDPKLFQGTIRHNLSPVLYRPDDEKMLDALRTVEIFGSVEQCPITYSDLDRPAKTLSRGQRQLLSIARGLLRRSRILILDEATANIDYEADERVQAGLRASLANDTTVITIAHRLASIADYDHVVVLESGRVVEYGSPAALLKRRGENAKFRSMCMDLGEVDKLSSIASEADRARGKDGKAT